jgi:hypothetical protein
MNYLEKIKKQFQGTRNTWGLYWELYGGLSAIFTSIYLWGALIFTILCAPLWLKNTPLCLYDTPLWIQVGERIAWFNLCNSVLPSILGFTLGGYAILLAFGGNDFMKVIAGQSEKEGGKRSPFMKINATFLHFIIIQVIALIFSIFCLAWNIRTGIVAFIGFFLFSYAITIALAAAFSILRLTDWYDQFMTVTNNNKDSKKK